MTASKIIRGEESGSVDRWELPDFGEAAATAQPGPTVRELEALQQAAYDEGFAQGRADGFAKGQEEGNAKGYEEGVERGYQEGFAKGQAEGHAEGRAAGEQEGRELVERMRRIFDALAEPIRELDDSVEQALTDLALTIARQIIRREIATQPDEILAVVHEAVGLLPLTAREVSVRLHPDDARYLRDNLQGSDEAAAWKLIDDPTISRGGCRVNSASSEIDATVEHRIAALAGELLTGAAPGGES